jgi:uracil phosphoribosyltransferase
VYFCVIDSSCRFVALIGRVGIERVLGHFPSIKIITAEVDQGLDERKCIVPGLGDFGCLYFGTNNNNDTQ